ncbi:hypothetical protein I544_2777 [Mycobacteroides abscessus subsp. bolletii 103]|nr:hypothetical protein I544_2777 [Mycobacteroides abscessus subsp. bolletii 103]
MLRFGAADPLTLAGHRYLLDFATASPGGLAAFVYCHYLNAWSSAA